MSKFLTMEQFFNKLDNLAGIEAEGRIALWLERLAFVFLVLMTLSAPHSIAATQTAWLLGMVFWIARFFIKPRPAFHRTTLFIPFALFLGWAVLSSVLSYAPDLSFDRLRNVTLFFIFFFAVNNLRRMKAVKFIAVALIFSCMVNVVWTPVVRLIGRGVEVQNIKAESPLKKADMQEGDTIVTVNGKKVSSPAEIIAEIEKREVSEINFYRPDFYLTREVKKSELLTGKNAPEKLGIGSWKTSRNWRSSGFYGHYATYAEVLQLIASLALGLFIAGFSPRKRKDAETAGRRRDSEEEVSGNSFTPSFRLPAVSLSSLLLFICVGLMAVALLLTVTRASQLAFMISALAMVLLGASRKFILVAVLIAVPVMIGGLLFLQQSREVGFFDTKDGSITWRQTVYREGFELWTQNPRHFLIGVGMDSIKRYKEEWGLFDKGKLPPGHFHSTPLQLVVERGLPALLFWLLLFGVYIWKMFKALRRNEFDDWLERGIVLGALGGAVGFFTSGLVHYNLGDGEVAMVFYLIMALGISIEEGRQAEREIGRMK